jgi:hypothetical protein
MFEAMTANMVKHWKKRHMLKRFLALLAAGWATMVQPAHSAGTITIALQQSVDINGRPLAGCLLFLFQVGTVATLQPVFSDPGLTNMIANPLQCDQTGRLPMFYLADGSIHVRLTDSGGVVVFDYPSMLVIGPSSGGGGGGGTVDPTTVASTGDIKFRATSETLVGWVKMNGTSIGSAGSGATQRANPDTQNLYVYLWGNCPQAHCPVATGRGATGLADFNANKAISLPDWRSRTPVGLDDMGTSPAGILQASNVTSGGGDGPTTPNATGGEANHALVTGELAAHNHTATSTVTDPQHSHTGTVSFGATSIAGGFTNSAAYGGASLAGQSLAISNSPTGITVATSTANTGSGTPHNNMPPFMLGTWYQKL